MLPSAFHCAGAHMAAAGAAERDSSSNTPITAENSEKMRQKSLKLFKWLCGKILRPLKNHFGLSFRAEKPYQF